MYDVGSWKVDHTFFEQMREAGIETRGFLKVRFPMFTSKVNYRNHRKVAVIDGRIGFVGGMNIAMRYLKGVSWGVWRDTHVRIEGCAVYGLQVSFLTDWYAADHSLITSSQFVLIDTVFLHPIIEGQPLYFLYSVPSSFPFFKLYP